MQVGFFSKRKIGILYNCNLSSKEPCLELLHTHTYMLKYISSALKVDYYEQLRKLLKILYKKEFNFQKILFYHNFNCSTTYI